jgi:hypothetical protein
VGVLAALSTALGAAVSVRRNVTVRGQHRSEAAWFALASSIPVITMSADRSTAIIVAACRRGRAHVTPGWPARTTEIMSALTPGLLAAIMTVVARTLLPSPSADPHADDLRRSRRLHLGWLKKILPRQAGADLNQPAPIAQ